MDLIPGLFRGVVRHSKEKGSATSPWTTYRILGVLSGRGSLSQTELSRISGILKTNLSPLVEKLVEEGAVERLPDAADRRVVRLSITRAGRDTLDKGMERSRSLLRAKLSVLSPPERKKLLGSLETLIALLDKATQEASHE
jgi:DNA-binding MarR family transcriptional regulator